MRLRLIALAISCLFLIAAAPAAAQEKPFAVHENDSRFEINSTAGTLKLVVESNLNVQNASISIELLSPGDKTVASVAKPFAIRKGRHTYEIPISIDPLKFDDLMWYRLKYTVSNSVSPISAIMGIISLSNLIDGYFDLYVTGGGLLFTNRSNTLKVIAVDSTNGKPVKGVEVEAAIEEDEGTPLIVRAVTDKNGFAALEFLVGKDVDEYDLDVAIKGRKNGVQRDIDLSFDSTALTDIIIQTDKPIYEPGQDVRIRVQAIDYHKRPVVADNFRVVIERTIDDDDDEDDEEELLSETIATSRFGIASTSWKIPEGTKLGNYRIKVEDVDDEVTLGSEAIRITRYDLPTFYVDAKTAKPFYLFSDETAELEISAQYLFGKPVVGGDVRMVFEKSDTYYKHEIKNVSGLTGEDGLFTARFSFPDTIAEELEDEKFVDLTFRAHVTDPATRRTEEKRVDLRVSKEPVHVYLLGRTYELSNRLKHRFYISTFYPDGTPASCDLTIFERQRSESAGDGDGRPRRVLRKAETNKYGIGKFLLEVPYDDAGNAADEIELGIGAADRNGLTGIADVTIGFEDMPGLSIETERTALQAGDPIEAVITSSDEKETALVDVVKNHEVLVSKRIRLKKGKNLITLPYQEDFRNELAVVVYYKHGRNYDDSVIYATRGLIYPTPDYLKIETGNANAIYRPGEDVTIDLRSRLGGKTGVDTAFGVLVLDKAIEERARTIGARAGNENINRTFVSRLTDFYGERKLFGRITFNEIKNIDLSRPLSRDFEKMLEAGLRDEGFKPKIEASETGFDVLKSLYRESAMKRLNPLANAIQTTLEKETDYPKDESSFNKLVSRLQLDPVSFRDPWNNAYLTKFSFDRGKQNIEFISAGPDKIADTADDFTVRTLSLRYFVPIGNKIDQAVSAYTTRTGSYIVDYPHLRSEILSTGVDIEKARDPFGNKYRYEFSVEGSMFVLRVFSNGPDGKVSDDDDFLWSTYSNYFAATGASLKAKFEDYVKWTETFPKTEAEMSAVLKMLGFDVESTATPLGPARLFVSKRNFGERISYYSREESGYLVVHKRIVRFSIIEVGADGTRGTFDDYVLMSFDGVIDESTEALEDYDEDDSSRIFSKRTTNPSGAIGGTVMDITGAAIPGADVLVISSGIVRKATTNNTGRFIFDNLAEGIYQLEAEATGFQKSVISALFVKRGRLLRIPVYLEVGIVSAMVDVTSNVEEVVNTGDTKIDTNITRTVFRSGPGRPDGYTPRIRSYFAETLYWQPELLSDKKGRAKINFKAADSLTTWKVYVVGSTAEGQFGMVEQEFQTFQPFFAELDPPKILTEGDEISLPVPVRNYTKSSQDVSVELKTDESVTVLSKFSSLLNPPFQTRLSIKPDSTQSAVFRMRAVKPSKESKLSVTAKSRNEGDGIERPIKIVPNGEQITDTQTRMFDGTASFDFKVPDNAFEENRKLSVKIYPTMFSHVHDAVTGLLERPHGCGEQTTSSTYPNLMILKFAEENPDDIDAATIAQAQNYLEEGYKRLLRYQTDSGFGYWNGSKPDVALTAYVLRFLNDAEDFVEVDERVIEKAEDWLYGEQSKDGSWKNSPAVTAYVAYALSQTGARDTTTKSAVSKALENIKAISKTSAKTNIAAYASLAAREIGDVETAGYFAEMLGPNWSNYAETPFNGWGRSAEIETAAITLSALISSGNSDGELSGKALLFIMQNKDKYGVWHSTRTTVGVLNALVEYQKAVKRVSGESVTNSEIRLNGHSIGSIEIDSTSIKPVVVETSDGISVENLVEITGLSGFAMAQSVFTYYIPWESAKTDARYFEYKVGFSRQEASLSDEIYCSVEIKKKFRSSGMLLAEIGLPPGADVDSSSLQSLKDSEQISSYDILPDRVVIYLPGDDNEIDFRFKFKPRYAMNAQTPPSTVYDYYNEEARSTVAPMRFAVK